MKFDRVLLRLLEQVSQVRRDLSESFRKLLRHIFAERRRLTDPPQHITVGAHKYQVSQGKFSIPVLIHCPVDLTKEGTKEEQLLCENRSRSHAICCKTEFAL